MLKSEQEYVLALRRIEDDREVAARQREELAAVGLNPQEIEHAMEPLLSFHAQLAEEVEWYQRIVAGDFTSLEELDAVGRLLIAIRIAHNISPAELAARLGVDEQQVIRDERDEYYGFTKEELLQVSDALGVRITTRVETAPERELVPAD